MNRRIILIIVAAVAFALLVGFIWLTFFKTAATPPANNGSFGTGEQKPGATGTTGGSQNNIPSNVQTPGSGGTAGAGAGTGAGGSGGLGAGGSGTTTKAGLSSVPGVDWLGSGNVSGGVGGGPTTNFIPKTATELNSNNVYGTPTIIGTGTEEPDDNLIRNLIGAGIGGAVACTPTLLGGIAGAGVGTGATAAGLAAVPTIDVALNAQTAYGNTLKSSDTFRDNFLNCLARTIARVALQQITASVVNWINSGFNGQPSFVTNYREFFTNVADQAAGEFIRSSALSFLCSPFQNQVRTAIAQSYARRDAAASCTLTGIIGNVNSFASGDFSQGGWQGLLAYIGVPTNNPFGAYQYAQTGLINAQTQAVAQKQQDYTIGQGFLSSEKTVCNGPIVNGQRTGCTKVVTTPGSTIAASLNKTLGTGQDSLNLAKNFDEIIGALMTQLMTLTLQSGLSTLSGTQGYASNFLTPEELEAQEDAKKVLSELQVQVTIAQQYGSVQQGSISDIQNTQQLLQSVVNCWETASSTPDLDPAKQQQAKRNAENAIAALHFYDPQIDTYNANITRANQSLVRLQELQTRAISVASVDDVEDLKDAYQRTKASGVLLTPADVTTAQQNRTTLQGALTLRNNQTTSELQQCNAFL